MKKILTLLTALLAMAPIASAQFGIVLGGGSVNSFQGVPLTNENVKNTSSAVAGVDYGFKFSRHLSLIPGARVNIINESNANNRINLGEFYGTTFGLRQVSLEVPVLVQYSLPVAAGNALSVVAFAGASFTYGLSKSYVLDGGSYVYDTYTGVGRYKDSGMEDKVIMQAIVGKAPKTDKSIILGAGLLYGQSYGIFVQMTRGLDEQQPANFGANRNLTFTVGLRFCPSVRKDEQERDF